MRSQLSPAWQRRRILEGTSDTSFEKTSNVTQERENRFES